MTRRILIPTDGSEMSMRAAERGVAFAKALGVPVTALHVIPEFHAFTFRAQIVLTYHTTLERDTQAEFNAQTLRCARLILEYVERRAAAAGVGYEGIQVRSDQPFKAIINAAKRRRCDLILKASHSRSGFEGAVLGSEAHKVLVHSKVPVLIWR